MKISENINYEGDLHVHTNYSHGENSVEEVVLKAISLGFKKIGISDHGPAHKFFGVKLNEFDKLRSEIEQLNKKYKDIEILLGVEANILEDGTLDIDVNDKRFDFIAAGFHFGTGKNKLNAVLNGIKRIIFYKFFKNNKKIYKKNTELIVNAVKNHKFLFLTHPGDKLHLDIYKVAKALKENNILFELNSSHYNYSEEELTKIILSDVKFILNSDAHKVSEMGKIKDILYKFINCGGDESRIVNIKHNS